MSEKTPAFPPDLRYAKSHEWARFAEGEVTVGITSFAVSEMGDIVHLELPGPGTAVSQGASFGVIDSVKASFDLYSPVSGTITAVNKAVENDPATISTQPYANGWMIRIRPDNPGELDALMDVAAYQEHLAGGGH